MARTAKPVARVMTRTSRAGRLNNTHGFTLVELGLVLFLLSLFAVFSLPVLYPDSHADLSASARKIAVCVRYVYNEAAITGAEHRIRCDIESGRFELEFLDAAGEWRSIESKKSQLRLKPDIRLKDIWIEETGKISGGSVSIHISPQGWMPATTIHLQAGQDQDSSEISIHLLPLSGVVEIEEGYHDFEG